MDSLRAQAIVEFDRWSRSYDRSLLQRFLFRPSHHYILEQVRADERVLLDVGCGTGVFAARALHDAQPSLIVGLDLSENMLRHAVTRLQSVDNFVPIRGDSGALPFADNCFDLVTCSHSFHHYPDQPGVVAEMHRVLRHGGRVIIVDGYRDRPYGWLIFDVGVTSVEGDVHHCSALEFRRLLKQAGFQNVQQRTRRFPVPFLLSVGEADKSQAAATGFVPRLAA